MDLPPKQIYYSVDNLGDGSAYPVFFTEKEVADLHQEIMVEEGWGEHCVGVIHIQQTTPGAVFVKEAKNLDQVIQELKDTRSNFGLSDSERKFYQALKDYKAQIML